MKVMPKTYNLQTLFRGWPTSHKLFRAVKKFIQSAWPGSYQRYQNTSLLWCEDQVCVGVAVTDVD